MIRIVIDTNVLVSGLLSELGPPSQIVALLLDGHLQAVYSDLILEEYGTVLRRPNFGIDPKEIAALLHEIEMGGLLVVPQPWRHPLPDPADEVFLAVAEAAQCPLVTGNARHYPKSSHGEVKVLTPREFIDKLREE